MQSFFRLYHNRLLLSKHVFYNALASFIAVIPLTEVSDPVMLLFFRTLILCGLFSQLFTEPMWREELIADSDAPVSTVKLIQAVAGAGLVLLICFIPVGPLIHFFIFESAPAELFYHFCSMLSAFLFTALIFLILHKRVLYLRQDISFRLAAVAPFLLFLLIGAIFEHQNLLIGLMLPPLLPGFFYFDAVPVYLLVLNLLLHIYLLLNSYWALRK
ncbi:MAG: hypothetical protein LPK19_04720 [Hymenobacteraceae bacterium]|nr:hypothetical protein [Hymenobacteraceae bacterium]MDX5395497.1 hypothetical protein [Hymenobacteraceae bacterium]MDX5511549.1 hypothetical protein [Hymenobacteraceae bacterium]